MAEIPSVNPNLNLGLEHRVGADLYPWEFNDTADKKYFVPDAMEMLNGIYHRALESQDVSCNIDRFNGTMSGFVRDQLINTKYGLSYNSYTLELPLYNINFFSTLKMKRLNPRIYTMDDVCKMQDLFEQRILFFIDGRYFSRLKIYADSKRALLVIDADDHSISLANIKSMIKDDLKWTLLTIPFTSAKKYNGSGMSLYRNYETDPKKATEGSLDMSLLKNIAGKAQADKNFWLMSYTTDINNTGLKDFTFCNAVSDENGYRLIIPAELMRTLSSSNFIDIEVISMPNIKGAIALSTGRYFQIDLDVNPIPPQNILLWEYFADTNTYEYIHNSHIALYYPNVYVISDVPDDAEVYATWCYSEESTMKFDNPLKEYMEYDTNYAGHVIGGELPDIVRNFIPYVSHFNERNYLQYAAQATRWHEYPYKFDTVKELIKNDPDKLKNIYEKYVDRTAYDWHANPHYIVKMDEWGSYADRIRTDNSKEISIGDYVKFYGKYIYFTVDHEDDRIYPIDVWIDGVYYNAPYQFTENYRTYIYLPINKIHEHSIIDFEIIKVREQNPVGIFMDLPAIHNSIAIPRGYFKDICPQNLLIAVREETSAANGEKLYIYNMANDYNMYWFLIGTTKYVNGIPIKSFDISMRGRNAVMCNLISSDVARYVYCDYITIRKSTNSQNLTVIECLAESASDDITEWHFGRIDTSDGSSINDGIRQNDVSWVYIGYCDEPMHIYIEDNIDNRALLYGDVRYEDGTPAYDYMISPPNKNMPYMGGRKALVVAVVNENARAYIYCDSIVVTKNENSDVYNIHCTSEGHSTFKWSLLGDSTWVSEGYFDEVNLELSDKFYLFGNVTDIDGNKVPEVTSAPYSSYRQSIMTDNDNTIMLQDTDTAILVDGVNSTVDDEEYFIERGFPFDSYYLVKNSLYKSYAENPDDDADFTDPFKVRKIGYYGETRRRHFEYLPYGDNDPTIYLTPITNHFAGKRVRIQSTDIYKKWVTHLPLIPRDDHRDEDRRITISDFRLDPALSKFRVFVNGRLCDFGYDCRIDVNTADGFILGSYVNIGVIFDPEDENCSMRYITHESNEMVVEYLPYKYNLLYRFKPQSQTLTLRTSVFKRPFSLKYYDVYINGIKCTEDDIEINTAARITLKPFIAEDTVVSFYEREHDPEIYGNGAKMIESLNDAFARELEGFRTFIQPPTSVRPSASDVASCVGCSTTCGTTCLGDCTSTCYGCTSLCTGCTGTCVGQCKNACADECGDGCVSSCLDTCFTACQNQCGAGCTGDCTGACSIYCSGSCTSSCVGMLNTNPTDLSCNGCDTTCMGCGGTCESVCVGTCNKLCSANCEDNCMGVSSVVAYSLRK